MGTEIYEKCTDFFEERNVNLFKIVKKTSTAKETIVVKKF